MLCPCRAKRCSVSCTEGCASHFFISNREHISFNLSLTLSMDYLQIAPHTGGTQRRWEVRGHEDDANKIMISDDGLELQMTDYPINEVECITSEPIHGDPGDLFYVEFELIPVTSQGRNEGDSSSPYELKQE